MRIFGNRQFVIDLLFAKYLQLGYYATIQFSPRVFYARTCSLMVMN
jgi:hypothetical protein